jgi:uncharacterized cupin superfamily protein
MEIFNLNGDDWNVTEEHEGFAFKDAWVGKRIGAELLGGSLYEVAPGKKLWPYHLHHANEEWIVVLRGRPTLRTPDGERELAEGDVACFLRGPAGAHQVRNDTDEPVRVLMLSTELDPEVLEYPDSDKIAATDAKGKRLFRSRPGEPVEYWEGEK